MVPRLNRRFGGLTNAPSNSPRSAWRIQQSHQKRPQNRVHNALIHHTLKKKPLRFKDLADFVACYNPKNRHKRKATWDAETNPEGRWRRYGYEELTARDKTSLDVFWLKDKSLTDLDNLPDPEVIAEEIIENLEAGLASFRAVLAGLAKGSSS